MLPDVFPDLFEDDSVEVVRFVTRVLVNQRKEILHSEVILLLNHGHGHPQNFWDEFVLP